LIAVKDRIEGQHAESLGRAGTSAPVAQRLVLQVVTLQNPHDQQVRHM